MTRTSPLYLGVAVAALLLGAGSGCGSDGKTEVVDCSAMFASGATTPDLVRQPVCRSANGEEQTVASSRWLCAEGPALFANEFGFGRKGEPWETSATEADVDDVTSALAAAIADCGA